MGMRKWLAVPLVAALGIGAWWLWPSAPVLDLPPGGFANLRPTAEGFTPTGAPPAHAEGVDAGPRPLAPLPWLGGEVRDDSGGVAQAEVQVSLRGPKPPLDCEPSGHTRTVAGGTFELGPLCPGQYDVKASRNAVAATAVVPLSRGEHRAQVTLLLRASTRLEVWVSDKKKNLLEGAKVEVQDQISGYVATGVTNSAGIVFLDGLAPRGHTLTVSKAGWMSETLSNRALSVGLHRMAVALVPGASLEGQVVDAEGLPLSGAELALGVRSRMLNGGVDPQVRGESSDGGFFSLGPVLAGAYVVVASHAGHRRLEQPVRVPGAKVTLTLSQGAVIDGTFVDVEGNPVLAGRVRGLLKTDESFDVEVRDGGFHAEGVNDGEWTVMGMAERVDGGAQGLAVEKVKIKGEEHLAVALTLVQGESIWGTCVSQPGGAPATTDIIVIEEAMHQKLMLSGMNPSSVKPGLLTIANCAGTFEATGLRAGRYRLVACGNHDDPPSASTGATDARVVCAADGQLRLRVVDAAGRAVTRFSVGREAADATEHSDGVYVRTLTGDLNEDVTIRVPGFATLVRHAEAQRSERLDLGDLRVSAPRRIEGRALDKNGAPIEGVDVRFQFDSKEAFFRTSTQTDGTFQLPDVPSEPSTVFFNNPNYDFVDVEVSATQTRVDVVMEAGLRLTGSVITSDGRPSLEYSVRGRMREPRVSSSCGLTDGTYELAVQKGEWSVWLISSSGHGRLSGFSPISVNVAGPGQRADFVERLGGVSFEVLPVDQDGQAIAAEVWLVPGHAMDPPAYAHWMTEYEEVYGFKGDPEEGIHTFAHVPEGKWRVNVHPTQLARTFWMTPITVSTGMPGQLRIVMPPGLKPYPVPH